MNMQPYKVVRSKHTDRAHERRFFNEQPLAQHAEDSRESRLEERSQGWGSRNRVRVAFRSTSRRHLNGLENKNYSTVDVCIRHTTIYNKIELRDATIISSTPSRERRSAATKIWIDIRALPPTHEQRGTQPHRKTTTTGFPAGSIFEISAVDTLQNLVLKTSLSIPLLWSA